MISTHCTPAGTGDVALETNGGGFGLSGEVTLKSATSATQSGSPLPRRDRAGLEARTPLAACAGCVQCWGCTALALEDPATRC